MAYIKRKLEATILGYLKSPEILAVVGPRQAGKTTMISRLVKGLPRAVSLSFDDKHVLNFFEKETEIFIKTYVKGNKYLFIDEFQYSRNGGQILKYIYDTQNIKIIISGSSVAELTIRAIKHLVGRVLVFDLHTFDFEEFLSARDRAFLKLYRSYKKEMGFFEGKKIKIPDAAHKKFLSFYEEYLIFGGYPRVVLEENIQAKKDILRNIYNTYFLREVRDILGLVDDYKLENLIRGLALQVGSLVEYQELCRLSGYSFLALKKYLNFLKKTYICEFARPFYKNKRTEVVKNPKIYFQDTGFRNAVVDDFRKLNERTDKGALLENGLAAQFIRGGISVKFWRDKRKNEVDFILSLGDGKTVAIESKSHLKENKNRSVAVFRKKYPQIKTFLSYQEKKKNIRFDESVEEAYPVYLF